MTAPISPTILQALDDFVSRRIRRARTMMIAKVERWDAATQTADVLPLVKESVADESGAVTVTEPSVIPGVPVMTFALGGFTVQVAPSVGDVVTVLVSDRDIETWLAGTGGSTTPETTRHHDANDAVILPWRPAPTSSPVPDIASGELVIGRGDGAGELRIRTDGTLIGGARGATTKGVARLDDTTQSTSAEDASFWAWVAGVDAALRAGVASPGGGVQITAAYNLAVPVSPGAPTSATGKITTASAAMEVE